MSTDPPEATAPQAALTASQMWELASKGFTVLAAAVYICGFLVISLYHSSYGFAETNPFRAKIFSAGAWYLLFMLVPVAVVTKYQYPKTARLNWQQFFSYLYPYYFFCIVMAWMSDSFFNPPVKLTKWDMAWALSAVISLGVVVFLHVGKGISPKLASLASLIIASCFVIANARRALINQRLDTGSVTLWFFAIGVMTLLELHALPLDLQAGNLWKPLFVILASLFAFSSIYYPHIKASWGGGSPTPIVMYLGKDSVMRPSERVSVQLVDESDAGFYILGHDEKRAIFIPRSAVSLVYFSDTDAESKLLRPSQSK
jgi:hypothetical protein